MSGTSNPKQPEKHLQLYDMEACPYCRRVREVLTSLNIDYVIKPCPKGGTLYRRQIEGKVPNTQFPTLYDPNLDQYIQESEDIIAFLYLHYSDRPLPTSLKSLPKKEVLGSLASAASLFRGLKAAKKRTDTSDLELLELFSFEASPYSRPVRERLCELEIAYIYRNVAKERWQDAGPAVLRLKPGTYHPKPGGKREQLKNTVLSQKVQVPYLIDPNHDVAMYESAKILKYLNLTYARGSS